MTMSWVIYCLLVILPLTVIAVPTEPSSDLLDGEELKNARAAVPLRRVCLVYTARDNNSATFGPDLTSTQYVRQSLDVEDVAVTITLQHNMVGALQFGLVANSSFAASPAVVLLKVMGPGGTGTQMINTTFTDDAVNILPHDQSSQPFIGSYLPDEPLAGLAEGHSPYAGLGGSVGTWSLVLQDTWPQDQQRLIQLESWTLRLCGHRLPRVDAAAAGALPPDYNNMYANTTVNATIDQQQQQQQSAGDQGSFYQQFRSRVLDHLDDTMAMITNSSVLDGSLQSNLIAQVKEFRQELSEWPKLMMQAADEDGDEDGDGSGGGSTPKKRFQQIIDTVRLCHNDLYLCWKKLQNRTISFPVAELDVEISRRYAVRAKQQQQRLTNIEIQVKQALDRLKDRYPNLSERLGVQAEQVSGLLSQAVTQELYQAALGSAAVAYYGAYLDAVLGFSLLGTRARLFLNPRALVYRVVTLLQGLLGTVFYGLTYVPLFPQLVGTTSVPILVNTAIRSGQAFRSATQLLDEGMQQNVRALMNRRDYVLDNMVGSLRQTSDSFESQLAQSAPGLAQLYSSVATTVEGVLGAGNTMRQQAQDLIIARMNRTSQLRQQAVDSLGTVSAIAFDLVNATSGTVYEARQLLDAIVPGQSPLEILQQARDRTSEAVTRAGQALQQIIPLGDVQQMVELYNSTVDGMLRSVQEGAATLQSEVPGPVFFRAMDTLQQGLDSAQQQVVEVQDALATQWPGPLLNASLQVINTRTQQAVDEVDQVLAVARTTFPATDPQMLFRRLNQSIDSWYNQISDPIRTAVRLAPPDAFNRTTQQIVDGVSPLVQSLTRAIGKAADDMSRMVVPAVAAAQKPAKDTIKGLNDMVMQLNDMLFQLTKPVYPPQPKDDKGKKVPLAPGQPGVYRQAEQPSLNILSDSVSEALTTLVRDAPIQSTIVNQISKSLKDIQGSIEQRQQTNQSTPVGLMGSAVRAVLQQVNATTQPWQGAVRTLDSVAELVPGLSLGMRRQFDSLRGSMIDSLGNFSLRTSDFALKWANSTAERSGDVVVQGFRQISDLIRSGQRTAGQLADTLEQGSQRLFQILQPRLPVNDTLMAMRHQLASAVGLPLDQLQAAIANATDVIMQPLSARANATAQASIAALQVLNNNLAPALATLRDINFTNDTILSEGLRSAINEGSFTGPVPLLSFFNASINQALASAMEQLESTMGAPQLRLNNTGEDMSDGTSETAPVRVQILRSLIKQTQAQINTRLTAMIHSFSRRKDAATNMAIGLQGPVASALLQQLRHAAQQMRSVQQGLRQAGSETLPVLALPPLTSAVDRAFAGMAEGIRQQIEQITVGGLFPGGQLQLGPVLNQLKSALDDYNSLQVDTPADLVGFVGSQLANTAASLPEMLLEGVPIPGLQQLWDARGNLRTIIQQGIWNLTQPADVLALSQRAAGRLVTFLRRAGRMDAS